MFLSIAVDAWRSRALGRIATKYDSQALEADALHFSTDIWSSSVVILGLALVWAGRRYQHRLAAPSRSHRRAFCGGSGDLRELALGADEPLDALLDAAPAGVRSQILDRDQDSRWRARK